ncbi:MAG: putative family acetyltransferase [Chitinophagaceae bacterium]|nr:putative family acetyltransferase [Chitinophagaceae bacterium]
MNIIYRKGNINDLTELKNLAIKSWRQFESKLTSDNWLKLYNTLTDDNTYTELLDKSTSIICTTDNDKVIGMAFLVPKGNPTDIYDKDWCYIRFVSVDPEFGGQGIGKKLTTICIATARQNNEGVIALHTSELMDKARHIYESIGFTILREIDKRLGKRYWLYKLDLTEKG